MFFFVVVIAKKLQKPSYKGGLCKIFEKRCR